MVSKRVARRPAQRLPNLAHDQVSFLNALRPFAHFWFRAHETKAFAFPKCQSFSDKPGTFDHALFDSFGGVRIQLGLLQAILVPTRTEEFLQIMDDIFGELFPLILVRQDTAPPGMACCFDFTQGFVDV